MRTLFQRSVNVVKFLVVSLRCIEDIRNVCPHAKQQDDSPLSSHLLPPLCLPHVVNAGGCLGHACEWYTQWTTPPANMTATNCDSMYRTMGVNCSNGQGASLCLVVVVVVVVHEK
jgi:hypothetical protein